MICINSKLTTIDNVEMVMASLRVLLIFYVRLKKYIVISEGYRTQSALLVRIGTSSTYRGSTAQTTFWTQSSFTTSPTPSEGAARCRRASAGRLTTCKTSSRTARTTCCSKIPVTLSLSRILAASGASSRTDPMTCVRASAAGLSPGRRS